MKYCVDCGTPLLEDEQQHGVDTCQGCLWRERETAHCDEQGERFGTPTQMIKEIKRLRAENADLKHDLKLVCDVAKVISKHVVAHE